MKSQFSGLGWQMQAEQRVVLLPRGIQELGGIVFSDVKIQAAAVLG